MLYRNLSIGSVAARRVHVVVPGPTGVVESFPGCHGGMGSLLSTRFRQPQVKSDDKVQHNCFNSFVVIQSVQSILRDGVWMFSLLCE